MDLVNLLKTEALANDWHFIYGRPADLNFSACRNEDGTFREYVDGQLVMGVYLNTIASNFSKANAISKEIYNGALILGRKFDDDGTAASLDETDLQKYDRRFYDLMELLKTFLIGFACDNGLSIDFFVVSLLPNQYDTDIDFVSLIFTLSYEN